MLARAAILALAGLAATSAVQAQKGTEPVYKIDPFWPKMPLPNKWIIQGVPTMVTDKDDHIWVLNRPRDINPDEAGAATNPPRTDCCIAAPAVLEFDTAGNLLKSWGGPGYTEGWPAQGYRAPGRGRRAQHHGGPRRQRVDLGQQPGRQHSEVHGRWQAAVGFRASRPAAAGGDGCPKNNQNTDVFPGGIFFFDLDEDAQEIYIVDAKRVLVYDYDGKFKRGWGGHGIPLSEIDNHPTPPYDTTGNPPDQKQFAPALHCVHFAVDKLVYVCERGSDRVQVFTKQGKFVSSFFVHPSTPSRGEECGGPGSQLFGMCGTIYNLTFSHDADEKYVLHRRRHQRQDLDPRSQDRRSSGLHRRQRPHGGAIPLDRRYRHGFERQPLYRRSGYRQTGAEIHPDQ